MLNRFNCLNDPVNFYDPWGLQAGGGYSSIIGLDPSAHPVFQPGSYENQLIANDLERMLKLFDPSPAVTSAIQEAYRNNDKPCKGNDINPHKFSPSEIAEMNKRAKMLTADMRYQQLKREMRSYRLE